MTDNRTTELLCKLLEERGVEYKTHDFITSKAVTWHGNVCDWVALPDENGLAVAVYKDYLTPEQAIAVTLGSGREKALEELVQDWQALYEEPDYGDCIRLRKRMQELGIEVIDE